MAFEDKKGIVVASPFKLQAEALLDVRQQVDTIAERDRLVTLKAATAGLRVFVKENSTSYVYTGSKWDPLATGAPYKHPTGDGNHHVPATGTTNAGKYLKAGATAGSEAWSSISAGDITGLPTKLPNPQALKFTGAATATYDGSGAVTVNIPTSGKTDAALTMQMNGGTTEGTNKFTFDGSAAKTVNITPALIGAAASSHTHNYAGSSSAGGPANSAVKLATARTINGVVFDGTKNIEIPNNYSKTLTNEDLNTLLTLGNYFAAGGNTVKNKPSGVENFGLEVYKIAAGHIAQKLHGSDNIIYYRFHNGTSYGGWSDVYSSVNKPTPTEIGAAASSHGHSAFKGATVSAAGGTGFVPAPGTGENNKYLRGDGTWQPISLTLAALGVTATAAELNYMKGVTSAVQTQLNGKAASSHTHTAGDITGLPTKLPNPQALKFTGAATATYDGSGAVTVNIPTAQASPFALTVQFNGGTTEGTNKFTFNGGAAKTVNITPAGIGAATSGHTHNYAGSSSAGGPANSAKKVDVPVGTVMWSTSSSSTFFAATMGGTWEVVGNIDAIINTSTSITFYLHKKKAL